MPKFSTNLNLRLDDSTTDASQQSEEWFDSNFGYTNSNLTKIDSAYKTLKDAVNNAPTKNGTGATGTWGINITGNAATSTKATSADKWNISNDNEVNFGNKLTTDYIWIGYRNNNIPEYRFATGDAKGTLANVKASNFIGSLDGTATTAVHDGAGNDINSTYIKNVAINNTSLTLTKGNNTTSTVAFKTDKNLTTSGMPADGKATGDLIRSIYPTLTVNVASGSAVKVTRGTYSFSDTTDSTGKAKFTLPVLGQWNISASHSDNTTTASINIDAPIKEYAVTLSYAKIFGVVWEYSKSSTALTRITKANDPNRYVNTNITTSPSPAVGTGSGSSPFDNYMPWKGMDEYNIVKNAIGAKRGESGFSRSSNDVMVYIPEFYYKVVDDSSHSRRYFYIANKATTGFKKHPGSGRYVGRYNTISGNYSRTGSSPYVAMTRATARSGARGKGDKWALYDYASWCAVWLLYIVEYADWNSQSKIGSGWTNGHSGSIASGGTDSMTYHTGRAPGSDGSTAVQYRHIENPWGNIFEWIDGINFHDNIAYVCTDISKYADDTSANYTNIGDKAQSNGYISATGYSSISPWSFYPTSTSGSETTYIPDYADYGSGWRVLCVGGYWDYGSAAGLFFFSALNASSNSSPGIGARLLFVP